MATIALLLASCGVLCRSKDASHESSISIATTSSSRRRDNLRCGKRQRPANTLISTIHINSQELHWSHLLFLAALVLTTQHYGLSPLLMGGSSNNSTLASRMMNQFMEQSSSSSLQLTPPTSFNYSLSTEDNYRRPTNRISDCASSFHDIRTTMDYTYHAVYNCERQRFQDSIIESMLGSTWIQDGGRTCSTPQRNTIVFTAGVMGAGKSHVVRSLHAQGRFPAHAFVTVDPDEIRRHLPEFEGYVQRSPELAGELTRKEAGYMAEILTEAALRRGQNVLKDGTLRDSQWYSTYLKDLQHRYPQLQTVILHITAPRDAVLARAKSRAEATGRVVPRELLERTMQQVPKSVQVLSQLVDVSIELHNPPDTEHVEIRTPEMTWERFQQVFRQTCANRKHETNVLLYPRRPLYAGRIGRWIRGPLAIM